MNDIVIKVENLSKRYKLGLTHHDRLGEVITAGLKRTSISLRNLFSSKSSANTISQSFQSSSSNPMHSTQSSMRQKAILSAQYDMPSSSDDTIWALRNVSFEVNRGEVLGVIGRNGAGKTTLLKILTGITEPTEGRVWMKGRIASLLEVGTGFHPELTGRENIFLNGAILGMTKIEIRRKFDEIVDFAEIVKFIDTPVKRYSSGMYVRLAFAVAAHLEPEILLVDEVLAVGDAVFQKKCIGKMGEVAKQGRTVLFVSHNMAAINKLCPKSILLNEGSLTTKDQSSKAIAHYLNATTQKAECQAYQVNKELLKQHQTDDNVTFVFKQIELLDSRKKILKKMSTGDPLIIRIYYHARRKFISPGFMISIRNRYGIEISRLSNMPISGYFIDFIEGEGIIELSIDEIPFLGDVYFLSFAFARAGIEYILQLEELISLYITPRDVYQSGVVLDNSWGIIPLTHHWQHLPNL